MDLGEPKHPICLRMGVAALNGNSQDRSLYCSLVFFYVCGGLHLRCLLGNE